MAKSNQIKKLVNGEIADADDVNQIVENAGSEGGLIPYSDANQQRDGLGAEDIGSINYPFGHLSLNQNKEWREIDTVSPSVASSILIKNLRRFITLKDVPDSFVGQAGKITVVNALETALDFQPRPGSVEMFTTGGNWTCPIGVNYIKVFVLGGGGGGGAGSTSQSNGGGGGGGGAYVCHVLRVTPASTYAVTIGAAGASGTAGGNGGNGGNSSMVGNNYTVTASGGTGGEADSGNGGAGGAGSSTLDGSDAVSGTGGAGGAVYAIAGGAGGDATGVDDGGGGGGSSVLGKGGAGGSDGGTATGTLGGLGAGGGGGAITSGGTVSNNGGLGGQGIVIIMYNLNGAPV